MKPEIRILLALLLGLVVDLYSHLFLLPILGKAQENGLFRMLVSISTVVVIGIIIWKRTANLTKEQSSAIVKGGSIGAIAGFLIGIVGPGILNPRDSGQGPLLGVFFTIPLGFILGLLSGVLYGIRKYPNS